MDCIIGNPSIRMVTTGPDTESAPKLFLVVFEDVPVADKGVPETEAAENPADVLEDPATSVDDRIAALKQELRSKEEYLQATNEELATSNEELKSSNEELQSTNEELATVNAELQQKVADLARVNNDMNNLLAGTGVGTVFVDFDLNIKRFTPAATQLINLIQTDVGRPVGHLASNLSGYDRLVEDVKDVLDTLVPKEIEVQNRQGAWYVMRIRPYRTLENVIEGAVITFVEITEQKRVQHALREAKTLRRLAAVVRDVSDVIIMQDFEGRILAWNPGAERIYGWREAEALSMNFSDMIPESSRDETLSMMRRLKKGEACEPMRVQRLTREGTVVDVWSTISVLVNKEGQPYAVSTIERKIPEPQTSRN